MRNFLHYFTAGLLLLALAMPGAFAYDFSAVCSSGQTLYYNITSSTEPYTVEITSELYGGYSTGTAPSGNLVMPSSVTYNGITYSVTSIASNAFRNCSGLTELTIPAPVASIGHWAFYNCSGLTTVNYNAVNCGAMGGGYGGAFDNCTSWETLIIGDNVTNIAESAFSSCSTITTVTIGSSVESIGEMAFSGCSNLITVNFNAINCTTMGSSDFSVFNNASITNLNIAENVTNIPENAFRSCSGLTSVIIPNSVTNIGNKAFASCTNLTSFTIGNSVASIGDSVFYNCSSLFSITIPNSVTSIGRYAFKNCSGLASVNFNATNCTRMGNSSSYHVFSGCSSLATLNIGENVTNIPNYAFYNCSRLTGTLTIPNSVTSIGNDAFYGCSGLTSITIGNSVTSVGSCAFYGCSSLTGTLSIPNSVTSIGGNAFYGCNGFTSVTIGNSVTEIGGGAFNECSGLTSVCYTGNVAGWCGISFGGNYANPLWYAQNLYINNSLVTNLTIPNTVTEIKSYAFVYATCLTSVTIGNSVTSIGYEAFYRCSGLTSVTIGNSVTLIDNNAFGGCSSLTSITSHAANPPTIYSNPFGSVNAAIPVYVPCGCVSAYNNANGWNYFTNIQQNPDCPTDIEENIIEELELYPNLVGNILNITSSETISEIEIVNVMGQVVYRAEVNADNVVCNVEDLKAGVYIVRIYGTNTASVACQRKFIKE